MTVSGIIYRNEIIKLIQLVLISSCVPGVPWVSESVFKLGGVTIADSYAKHTLI